MIWFLILVIDITLDAFVLMMEKGATTLKVDFKKAIQHSAIFAIIDSIMYMVGHIIADNIFNDSLIIINRYLTVIVFIAIGLKLLLITNKKKKFEEKLNNELNPKKSIKDAFFTGIDCLLVGVGCSYLSVPYFLQFIIVFFVPLIVLYIALYIGYYYGAAYQKMISYICSISYFILAILVMINLI